MMKAILGISSESNFHYKILNFRYTKEKIRNLQRTIQISTPAHNGLYDITSQVETIVTESGLQTGLVNVYAQGATAGIMIQFIYMYPLFLFRSISIEEIS
jgi:hypothetical protein